MRAMPSPTEMTLPSSLTSTPALNPSICCRRTLVISSALISAIRLVSPVLLPSPPQPLPHQCDLALQASVVTPRTDARPDPAEECGIHLRLQPHGAAGEPRE